MADYSVPVDRTYRPALPASSRIVGGAIAGLIAGILMGAAMTIYSAQINIGALTFWQSIAAMFYGPMAYVGDAGVTAIGVLTHLATAMTLGAFFGWITVRVRGLREFWLGIIYGTCVWAFMTWVTLQVFDETMRTRVLMVPVWWFFLHWIYGGFLGIFTPPFRRLATYRPPPAPVLPPREPAL